MAAHTTEMKAIADKLVTALEQSGRTDSFEFNLGPLKKVLTTISENTLPFPRPSWQFDVERDRSNYIKSIIAVPQEGTRH